MSKYHNRRFVANNGVFKFFMVAVLGSNGFLSGAHAQSTCPNESPHVTGTWRTLPFLMPINPISATLLNTGKVLFVAGSEWDSKNNTTGSESYRAATWDPANTTNGIFSVNNIKYDVFCSGTAVLPDGRPLIVGGTSSYSTSSSGYTGSNLATIFDPVTGYFAQTPNMKDGRWYGSATTLSDGRIMAFSGWSLTTSSTGSSVTNNTVEIYDVKNAGVGWSAAVAAPFSPPLFPREFLLPYGKVFYNGQGTSGYNGNSYIMDPTNSTWVKSAKTTMNRKYGSAVLLPLLPPDYKPVVMNLGGGNPATATTESIDLSASTLSWKSGPNMSTGRIQMNAIILPNGKVLAEGGSVNNEDPSTAGLAADLYDPVSNAFSSGGTASYARLYHSTALLLPDATVAIMGSNPHLGKYEPAIEIYSPAYLFDANDNSITTARPVITSPSLGSVGYGQSFSLTYTSTSPISSAVLVRPGSSTHAFDMEQRLIGLCGPAPQPACNGDGTTLGLTTPPNGNIAPPGYYMLFLLDSAGVPSVAKFIQLTPYVTTPPKGTIVSPTSSITIPLGGTVTFAGSSTSLTDSYSWVFPGGTPGTAIAQNPGTVTFNTPGTFGATLTTIDSSGNNDPSPPWRTITVLPTNPDFHIKVTPSAVSVAPGQNAKFTVTITPLSGFNDTAKLSVSVGGGFPSGVSSGGFSPNPIPVGSNSSTLTIKTSTTAQPYAVTLTITATSGSGLVTHTADTTLLVNEPPPAGLAATPGAGPGQVNILWQSAFGATDYHLKRSLVSGGPYELIACVTTGTSYTDTGLTSGVTYYYVVSAGYTTGQNGHGESADSGEISVVAP